MLSFLQDNDFYKTLRRRSYDLPLDTGTAPTFLMTLIGVMVFLALFCVSAAYILTSYANSWQTGLEGRWTIEIPAIDSKGEMIERAELRVQAEDVKSDLRNFAVITEIDVLEDTEIYDLVAPWFNMKATQNIAEDISLPLPMILSIRVMEPSPALSEELRNAMSQINPRARLDSHTQWLEQVIRIATTLRFSAILFTLTISLAAVIAIAGAVRARLSEHRENIELLHLMGATDSYITRQFLRHNMITALKGICLGLFAYFLFIYLMAFSRPEAMIAVDITFGPIFWAVIAIVPLGTLLLAGLTTKWTVLQTLQRML